MIVLKVQRFGESLGVVLPEEVIDRLQTTEGQEAYLFQDSGDGYRITGRDPTLKGTPAQAEEIMERYSNTLRTLAK